MNNSNAAAKRRRANIQTNSPPPAPTNTPPNTAPGQNGAPPSPAGLTLPQVIALIDTRLVTLEKFMKESNDGSLAIPDLKTGETSDAVFMDSKEFTEFVDEVNNRFQLFADEINNLKEVLLKLQTYTMDVNKLLLSELSLNGKPVPNITFEVENTDAPEAGESETFILESQNQVSEENK